jgi:dephospho-CoA kinase
VRVGLTGGVASGKSSVSRMLGDLGAVVVDADVLAREVVAPGTPGLAAVVEEFGPDVLGDDGGLDRTKLGAIVFADLSRRTALEAIVHPLVRARAAEIEAAAPHGALVVHDIPLLVETGQVSSFDAVLVVDVPTDVQVDRAARERGWSRDEARARIAASRRCDPRHRQHRNDRRPPPACDGGLRRAGQRRLDQLDQRERLPCEQARCGVRCGRPAPPSSGRGVLAQAARSGSPSRRSFCSASRSS